MFGDGALTFQVFAIRESLPLAAYVLAVRIEVLGPRTFEVACVLTGLTLFALGAVQVRITGKRLLTSGLETLLVGGAAAAAAYAIGRALGGLA